MGIPTTAGMTGSCGFCDADLATTACGGYRSCLRIVCETGDAGLGPIC